MKIQIKETGEIENLTIRDDNSIDWTADLITAASFDHNDDGDPIMTEGDYGWWRNYIDDYYKTESEQSDLVDDLIDSEIDCPDECGWANYVAKAISENTGNDYGDHRSNATEAMNEIRDEFLK